MVGVACMGCFLDYDLYVASQPRQAFQHLDFRNAAKPTTQHIGKLGLGYAEEFSRLRLRHFAMFDNLSNLCGQLRLDQHLFRTGYPKIRINISAALFYFPHVSAPSESRRASFNLASIKSISCFDV